MTSTLIESIDMALCNLDMIFDHPDTPYPLQIELRNLKMLLVIGSRKLGDAHFVNSSSTLPSLFSRIEDAIDRLCALEIPADPMTYFSYFRWRLGVGKEVNSLWKEVDEEWYTAIATATASSGPLLVVDDVVAIAESILYNCDDFQSRPSHFYGPFSVQVQVIDAFEEEIRLLKSLLAFLNHTDVQLNDLLILIQPIVINAARVFIDDEDATFHIEWSEVLWNCSMANDMVTGLRIYEAYAKSLRTSTRGPRYEGMDDGIDSTDTLIDFLDSLVSYVWDVLRHLDSRIVLLYGRLLDSRKDQYLVLYARLRSLRAILKKLWLPIHVDVNIIDRTGDVIHNAALLIFSLDPADVESDLGQISDLLQRFDVIEARIQICLDHRAAARGSSRFDLLQRSGFFQISEPNDLVPGDHSTNTYSFHGYDNDTQLSSHQPPERSTPQVVGFQDDEVESIFDRLTRGSNQLRIVPIHGMAGIGKTTFAMKLYNHRSTMYHFQARAWCPVSQVLDKKKVLVQLLNQIHESGSYSGMSEDDLADTLRRRLKGKRYLILLDDVWTLEVWNSLKTSFPDDSTRSRILLTSRQSDAAPHGLLDGQPYSLRLREDHECLEMLQMKLSGREEWNPITGMEMAKLCKGLPLMVVIVAGLLATTKRRGWEITRYRLRSGGVSHEELCRRALELSFMHLPDDLKLCFLYIGAFPEDEQVSVGRLIRLWMAEGFVKKNGSKTSEDVGLEYLENLIQRSLVMVVQSRSIGGVKYCRIHDIVHDFCRTRARQVNCFHLLHENDQLMDFNEPFCLQRLCIHSTPSHFKKSKLFCPHAHSLLFFSPQISRNDSCYVDMSSIIQIYKLLKVLDLQQFGFVGEIPSEIEYLTQLTYLSVKSILAAIPFSICNLSNLETLIAEWPDFKEQPMIVFPDTFWNLRKLKYLQVKQYPGGFGLPIGGFSLPTENLENCSNMLELETLSGVEFTSAGSMEKQLKKFPNIRRLRCTVKFSSKIVVSEFVNQLRSLSISGEGNLQCEFRSTQNLKKVRLEGFELSREQTAVIGKLPSLEVLKLFGISFSGGILEMEEGDFSNLKIFHLTDLGQGLRKWTASDDQLPNLQRLVLNECSVLEEIPLTCLENSATLEEFDVYEGCSTLESLVRGIEAVHADFGNFVKVSISTFLQRRFGI